MSASNGVIRINRKGKKLFAIGEEGPSFEIDVSIVYDQWYVIDQGFADEGGLIPTDKLVERNAAMRTFVCDISQCADVTMAEAQEFIKLLGEEVQKLRVFFAPKSPDKQSSPESLELRFSQ